MLKNEIKICGMDPEECHNDFTNTATATGSYVLNTGDTPTTISDQDQETVHCIKTEFEKTVNKTNVKIGDTVVYTLKVTNKSTVDFTNVVFFDNVPPSLDIIGSNPAGITKAILASGYSAGPLAKGSSKMIQYTVRVKDCNNLYNTAYAEVYFRGKCAAGQKERTESDSWQLYCKNPSILVEKSVDQCYVTENDSEREYTVTITNNGNVPISDFTFDDDLAGGTYVANTTYYAKNGVDVPGNPFDHDPSNGEVVVPDLQPGDYFTIKYTVDLG